MGTNYKVKSDILLGQLPVPIFELALAKSNPCPLDCQFVMLLNLHRLFKL
jgi:hypothetical protein